MNYRVQQNGSKTLYTKSGCAYCVRLYTDLQNNNINLEKLGVNVVVMDSPSQQEIQLFRSQLKGRSTGVPTLYIPNGDRVISGSSNIFEYLRSINY